MVTVEKILSFRSLKKKQVIDKRESLGDGTARNGKGYSRTVSLSGRVGCHGSVRIVQQVWNLLASSIEVMAQKPKESCSSLPYSKLLSSTSTSTPTSGTLSVKADSMPMGDGTDFNWALSALGRSLLCRCVNLLRQNGDIQTLATVVCIFGGSDHLVDLMTGGRRGEGK